MGGFRRQAENPLVHRPYLGDRRIFFTAIGQSTAEEELSINSKWRVYPFDVSFGGILLQGSIDEERKGVGGKSVSLWEFASAPKVEFGFRFDKVDIFGKANISGLARDMFFPHQVSISLDTARAALESREGRSDERW